MHPADIQTEQLAGPFRDYILKVLKDPEALRIISEAIATDIKFGRGPIQAELRAASLDREHISLFQGEW